MKERTMKRAVKRFNDKANRKELVRQHNNKYQAEKFFKTVEGQKLIEEIKEHYIESIK